MQTNVNFVVKYGRSQWRLKQKGLLFFLHLRVSISHRLHRLLTRIAAFRSKMWRFCRVTLSYTRTNGCFWREGERHVAARDFISLNKFNIVVYICVPFSIFSQAGLPRWLVICANRAELMFYCSVYVQVILKLPLNVKMEYKYFWIHLGEKANRLNCCWESYSFFLILKKICRQCGINYWE